MKYIALLYCMITVSSVHAQDFTNASFESSCLIDMPPDGWDGESTSADVDCDSWYAGVNPGVSPDGGHFIHHQIAHIESIDQTVSGLDIGLTYEISTYIAAGEGGDFNIYIDDVLLSSFPGGSPYEWHLVTTSFVAAGVSANIKFEWDLVSGDTDGAMDGASIDLECVPLTTTISSYAICLGETVTIEGTSLTGGVVSWDGGIENGVPFSPASAGTFTYFSTSTSEDDCGDSLTLVVHDLPFVEAGEFIELCVYETFVLTGSGAGDDASYTWDGGVLDGFEHDAVITALYTVTGTALTGCSNTDTVSVFVNHLPSIFGGVDVHTCVGNSVTLVASGILDGEYEWDGGVIDGVPFVADVTATYTVTGTDENGCSNWDEVMVVVEPQPIVEITPLEDDIVCLSNEVVNLTATPSGGLFTGEGLAASIFQPNIAGIGEHYVHYSYEDEFGCGGIDSVLITVVDCLGLEKGALSKATLSPNPFKDYAILNFGTTLTNEHSVLIYDMLGQVVYFDQNVFGNQLQINRGALESGTYILNLYDSNALTVYSTKLIVQ